MKKSSLKSTISTNHQARMLMGKKRMFGHGARYDDWVHEEFLNEGISCVGFDPNDNPEVINQMTSMRKGDFIYLKAYGPSSRQLCILGCGIITSNRIIDHDDLGLGRKVEWICKDEVYLKQGIEMDKLRNHRTSTIYEEHNPNIQMVVLNMILNPIEYIWILNDIIDNQEK